MDSINSCPTADDIRSELFLLSMATDESIHLDGLYILLRKDPAGLLRLLQRIDVGNNDNSTSIDIVDVASMESGYARTGVQSSMKNRKRRRMKK